MTTAALNSNDMRVRESGIEVELAAYGLAKNSASVDYLLTTAESTDHARKIWALWALGLMANRGVETEHVVEVLIAHLKDSDEDSRRWAVEGMALTGSALSIEPLLKTMHDDPSATVRERAACSLAIRNVYARQRSVCGSAVVDCGQPSLMLGPMHEFFRLWATSRTSDYPTIQCVAGGTSRRPINESIEAVPSSHPAFAAFLRG